MVASQETVLRHTLECLTVSSDVAGAVSAVAGWVSIIDDGEALWCACSLDRLLGGGLREGHLLEVAGEPGAGKSQLCMQARPAAKIVPQTAGA